MIRAALFDAAGTLIHLREPVGETYARTAAAHGIAVAAATLSAAFPVVVRAMPPIVFAGLGGEARREAERDWWRTVVARVFAAAGAPSAGPAFERCFDALFVHFGDAAGWRAADGAVAALSALRGRALRTGMVSNFDYRLPKILDALALSPLLDVVVLPGAAGAAKPDPRIFRLALERLRVAPSDAVYIGDDPEQDIAGARAAGLHAIDVATLSDLGELVERV